MLHYEKTKKRVIKVFLTRISRIYTKLEEYNKIEKQENIMILILEIILLVYGIIAINTGKFKLNNKKVVEGPRARLLGFLCLMPIPFSIFIVFIYGTYLFFHGVGAEGIKVKCMSHSFYLEAFSFISIFLVVYFLNKHFYKTQNNEN